jgi:hypothetical protein
LSRKNGKNTFFIDFHKKTGIIDIVIDRPFVFLGDRKGFVVFLIRSREAIKLFLLLIMRVTDGQKPESQSI